MKNFVRFEDDHNGLGQSLSEEDFKLHITSYVAFLYRRHGFFTAARNGNEKDVKRYLEEGVSINLQTECHQTALLLAIQNRQVNVANLLLPRKADPDLADDNRTTPLHSAIKNWTA